MLQGPEQSKLFSNIYRTGQDVWTQIPYEDLAASLLPKMSDQLFLDIGSGRGKWVYQLLENGHRVIGIDIVPELVTELNDDLEYRQAEHFAKFMNLDIFSSPFTQSSFDCVTDLLTFHHLPPRMWRAYVREVADLLPRNGLYLNVVLSRATPNFMGMRPSDTRYAHGLFAKHGLSYYFFTAEEIRNIFSSDFTIVAQHSASFNPPTDPADEIVLIFTLLRRR